MSVGAQVLAQNQSLIGSSSLPSVQGLGGRSVLVVNASAYGGATSLFLQCQGPSGAWINVNSSGFTADTIFPFDSPPGQYRLVSNASSTIGVYAVLSNIQY
jgi:hypothetical protein